MKNVVSGMLRRVALVRTDVSEECYSAFLRSVSRLLLTAIVVLSSPSLVTLMMEALGSSASVLTRATLRNIPDDNFLHSHRLENLKSYIALTGWAL
jgi:hypothetical protein